jgi:AdoMet-dependent heme synthase
VVSLLSEIKYHNIGIMSNKTFYARNPKVNWFIYKNWFRRFRISLFIFDQNSIHFYNLNEMASAIWLLYQNAKKKEMTIKEIKSKYKIKEREIADCILFINSLLKEKLIIKSIKNSHIPFLVNFDLKIKRYKTPKVESKRISYYRNIYRDFRDVFKDYRYISQLYFPLRANLDVTHKCNLNCNHCFFYSSKERRELSYISLSKIKKIIDKISTANIPIITLSGGEPFTRKDILKVIRYANKKKISVIINTNSTLLNEDIIKKLKKTRCSIHLSLEGSRSNIHDSIRGRGNFSKILNSVNLIRKNNILFQINFTINKKNFYEINKMYGIAKMLGAQNLLITPITRVGIGKHQKQYSLNFGHIFLLKTYILLKKRYINRFSKKSDPYIHLLNCVNHSSIHIGCSGDINQCLQIPTLLSFGNIFKQNILEIWYSKEYTQSLNLNLLGEPCKSCFFKQGCSGGCRAESYARTGDYYSGNKYCFRGKISSLIHVFIRFIRA